ncbi:Rtr1/RPAP2 family-domain-containing protein, partial [Chytriomyces sp. MP71]
MAADHSTNASAGTPQSGPQAMSTGAGKRGPAKRGSKGKAKTAAQTPPSARQEAVRTSMVKRKEWEDEVFRAMECAFDRAVSAADLRKWAAKYFEQRHYSDIVEERIANNLCGYPLCSNPVQKLNGKYRISFSQKQVYDISDLKKFCSKECMAASRYTISQLSLDPGYMRDIEQVFEVLDILDMDSLVSM